ncbi:MAG TPA: amylo-alpha-1,6-glucosidase, partial [Opitutaceae bacterium]
IQKRIIMPYLQNTVHITYTLLSEQEGVNLELRPSLNFRPIEANLSLSQLDRYEMRSRGEQFEFESTSDYPPLRMKVWGQPAKFLQDGGSTREITYVLDDQRGYPSKGKLWSPGYFIVPLKKGISVTLIASTEDWHTINAFDPEAAFVTETDRRRRLLRNADPRVQSGIAAELVLAADQFIIMPAGRIKNAARARAAGDELRSVIAGYHWFTDWGRDTMISLEGLTLTTRRYQEAAWILRTFAQYVKRGLIPNMFPEGQNDGLYNTADASLWFFHAVNRYVLTTGDENTLIELLPTLNEMIDWHIHGTDFGIGVDPADGLLKQGAEGYQLTWMDAKVGDWVVTPRRGKAVEINALWYNALRLTEGWTRQAKQVDRAKLLGEAAQRAKESFNKRFWNPELNCLFDVVDTEQGQNDPSIRPNQVFAIALQNPVLDEDKWVPVMKVVEEKLLTPRGLRSLSRENKDYKPKYFGDLRSRDAAYHQGTVWAWLIGPFIDAWLKVHPQEKAQARKFVEAFAPHLDEGCIGSISEIFDAEPPFTQRGCIAQAWSVAEVLRSFSLTATDGEARP